jgi:hypothetical protein
MGPWGIAALVAVAAIATKTGRSFVKEIIKAGLRTGYQAKDTVVELADKAKESTQEFMADAKAEEHKVRPKKRAKAANE